MTLLTADLISKLKELDTPTVCNALEIVVPERRGYGFTTDSLKCLRPDLKPMIGFARTAKIRAKHPSDLSVESNNKLLDDYYKYIDQGPKPSVVVIEDLDEESGYGCFWGEVNSAIHMGLGCSGVITNGGVRDLADVAPGFQMLAGKVTPSHAFVHLVEFGEKVTVAGMDVGDGEILHADQHGAVVLPNHSLGKIEHAAKLVAKREKVIIDATKRKDFDYKILMMAKGNASDIH